MVSVNGTWTGYIQMLTFFKAGVPPESYLLPNISHGIRRSNLRPMFKEKCNLALTSLYNTLQYRVL